MHLLQTIQRSGHVKWKGVALRSGEDSKVHLKNFELEFRKVKFYVLHWISSTFATGESLMILSFILRLILRTPTSPSIKCWNLELLSCNSLLTREMETLGHRKGRNQILQCFTTRSSRIKSIVKALTLCLDAIKPIPSTATPSNCR